MTNYGSGRRENAEKRGFEFESLGHFASAVCPAATGVPVPQGQLAPVAEELAAYVLVPSGQRLVQPEGDAVSDLQDVTDGPHHGDHQVYDAGGGRSVCSSSVCVCVCAREREREREREERKDLAFI